MDGRLYILASPSPGLLVFDAQGKQVLSINEVGVASSGTGQGRPLIMFGEDCDGAADGKIYVADRGANSIQVFFSGGHACSLGFREESHFRCGAARRRSGRRHASRAALGDGFDKNGRDVREFGDPEPLAERAELNRFLNIGQLATDAQDHLYYAFAYLPEPTVRQYDRLGYAGQEIQYTAVAAFPAAQAARKEILRQESKGKEPSFKRVLTAVGVDRTNGEVWWRCTTRCCISTKKGTGARLTRYIRRKARGSKPTPFSWRMTA